MLRFLKQFVFVSLGIAILMIGGVIIYGAIPQGVLKINPILGHDLDLNALYYGQAGNNTVHDITTQDISISAWVKVDVDASGFMTIINKRSDPTYLRGYAVYSSNGLIAGVISDGTNSYQVNTSGYNIRDNKWHYITFILDKDTDANCKVYVDGVNVTVGKTGTLASVGSLTSTYILGIGGASGGAMKLDGQIRDVKLYYAAGDHWSDAQVLYQAQHPFDYSANAGTMTDYWRLDEGSGTTLYGKVNNLTLSNVLAWTTQPKIKMVKQENATTTGNNPVGWWKMDEGTAIHGSTVADSSGYGNTGTLSTGDGSTNKAVAGKLGKGLSFDGVDDYVSVGSIVNAKTISFWYKTGDNDQNSAMGYGGSVWGYIQIGQGAVNQIVSEYNGDQILYVTNIISNLSNNNWHFVTQTIDGTTLKVYWDGQSQSFSSYIYTAGVYPTVKYIGTQCSAGVPQINRSFNGSIDDVRIYNRALTAGEVAQMYNSTKDGYLGNIKVSTGLVGYWKLDDNNALTSVIDYSGKGNTGTAYSSTATTTSVLSTSTAMVGRAMSFDGVDDWVNTGPTSLLYGATSLTVSAWIKPNIVDANQGIVARGTTYAGGGLFMFLLDSNGYAKITVTQTLPYAFKSALSASPLNIGQWYHVVGVVTTNSIKIYVDGVGGTPTSHTGIVPLVAGGALYWNTCFIGRQMSGSTSAYYFNGLIDEVKIWNYARSGEQIKQDYAKGLKHEQ